MAHLSEHIMMNPDELTASTPEFSDAAIGAVVALVRVVELYDPAVAHRAALRAIVADRLIENSALGTNGTQRADAVAAAALADIDLAVSRPADPEAAHEPTRSMLGATIVSRLPGLRNASTAIANRRDRWDANTNSELPFAAQIVAITDCLVGNPAAGFVPTWDHALRRVDRNRGALLDPDLCDALAVSSLDDIEAPPIPSAAILELLKKHATGQQPLTHGTEAATTIRNAVEAAGEASQLMTLFAQTAQRTVNAAEVLIWPFAETQLTPEALARATDGQSPALASDWLADLSDFSVQAELRAGVTVTLNTSDADHTPTDNLEPNGPTSNGTSIAVPITAAGETWGIIVAARRDDENDFDEHDLSIIRHIASEAAEAITSTAHWAEIEHMALRDQLTGLANRHELYRVLDAIFERPPLERLDTALIMCDVDGLKVVNDTQGHQAGDRLLADAAAALRGAVRDPERTTACRIGGDEFCMVIDGGGLLTAHEVSDMIERLFARSAGSGTPRSISCGIAFAGEDIDSRSALLRAADENQYQTKRARKALRDAENGHPPAPSDPPSDRRAIRD